jgi:predicted RNA binding protein YcfA (HicA-like mRNA interferase family)
MMLNINIAPVKKTEILKAITDELGFKYTDRKTSHIRLTNETICIAGRKSVR